MTLPRRPWPIVLIALVQILTPLGSVLLNSFLLQMNPVSFLALALDQPPWDVFSFFCLMPIAGFAVFAMQRWSYLVFLGAFALVFYENVQTLSSLPNFPIWLSVGLAVLNVVTAGYFMMPPVREAYNNPQARYWFTKPRYEVTSPASGVAGQTPFSGQIVNISEGGCFLATEAPLRSGDAIEISTEFFSRKISIKGVVVHQIVTARMNGYGVRFAQLSGSEQKEIEGIITNLKEARFPARLGPANLWEEALAWLGTKLGGSGPMKPPPKNKSDQAA